MVQESTVVQRPVFSEASISSSMTICVGTRLTWAWSCPLKSQTTKAKSTLANAVRSFSQELRSRPPLLCCLRVLHGRHGKQDLTLKAWEEDVQREDLVP